MSTKPAIKIENLSKQYRLGTVGTGTFSNDVNRWWHTVRGKPDPYLAIGEANDRTSKGSSDYVWALQDINFEVQPGEILGIIGKNGAGKSTLLKLLSRVTAPTTGKITAHGRIASLLEVGTGFHPELTGRENVFLNGAIMGMTKQEISSKFDEIVDFSGCERYIDTPVKRYSSGMYVRLAFAVAAHLEPEILIVDEVLAVGDAEFQKKAIGKMQEISEGQGRTVLFVSHNMASIQNLCNRLVVMNNGTNVFDGNVNKGIEFYLSSGKKNSEKSLKARTDRTGSGVLFFTHISITDFESNYREAVCIGDDIIFKVEFNIKETLKNVVFRLQIVDRKGYIITTLNNSHTGHLFNTLDQDYVLCKIPKIPLLDGEYTVNLLCIVGKSVSDNIENAFKFNIIEGDFFNSGRIPGVKEGVLVNHTWELAL
jgi:lipopolysaccharide transport system ATP-binding protein